MLLCVYVGCPSWEQRVIFNFKINPETEMLSQAAHSLLPVSVNKVNGHNDDGIFSISQIQIQIPIQLHKENYEVSICRNELFLLGSVNDNLKCHLERKMLAI